MCSTIIFIMNKTSLFLIKINFMSKKASILNKKSIDFLEKYLNNASPTGYESEGQKR